MNEIKRLRNLAITRLHDLINTIGNKPHTIDPLLDQLVRVVNHLPNKPSTSPPFVGIWGKGKELKDYRQLSLALIKDKIEMEEYTDTDIVLDTILRTLSGLPNRPINNDPYVNLFPKAPEALKPRAYKPYLKPNQRDNVDLILTECQKQELNNLQDSIQRAKVAYILGTSEHEAGFLPVREGYSDAAGRVQARRNKYRGGELYYGRGFVQLTHIENYKKYEQLLGIPLVSNPDLVLDPKIAAFIIVHGMLNGTFTGRKLDNYFNEKRIDYVNARAIVNGSDRCVHIAQLARDWLVYL